MVCHAAHVSPYMGLMSLEDQRQATACSERGEAVKGPRTMSREEGLTSQDNEGASWKGCI